MTAVHPARSPSRREHRASPRRRAGVLVGLVLLLSGCQPGGMAGRGGLPDALSAGEGLDLDVYAIVPGAGALAHGADGAVLVATAGGGIVELRDADADGTADTARHLLAGLAVPLSLAAMPDGTIAIAGPDGVVALEPSGRLVTVLPSPALPEREPDKALRLTGGPDGRLYVAIPAACSSCRGNGFEESVLRMRPDGHEMTVFARGVAWPGGMAWHRASGHLLVTDRSTTGRAPDALKVVRSAAADPLFEASIVTPTPAGPGTRTSVVLGFEAASSPRGLVVLEDRALIALAGSGPPDHEVPPRVVAVPLGEDGRAGVPEVVVAGFGAPGRPPRGRPVDLLALGDGSVLISDDLAGLVYRLAPAARPG